MFKMIKMDWLAMKFYQPRILIVFIGVCIMGFMSEYLIIPMTALCMLSYSVNPFAVEEKGQLDNLYLSLPVTRKSIVNARYGLSLIIQFAGLIFGAIFTIIISQILYDREFFYEHSFKVSFNSIFILICISFFTYATMNLLTFPTLFKLGYTKGKNLGFYIPCIVVTTAAYIIYALCAMNDYMREKFMSIYMWSLVNPLQIGIILLAAAFIILAISYALSQRIYAKREF